MLRGQFRDQTTIRLKDATFTDPEKPEAIMWCGGFGSADWFHNYVENLTFDVGAMNPGATALQFYSNNSGAVRDCRFVARTGSGVVGLDLAHRDMNGPVLVRNPDTHWDDPKSWANVDDFGADPTGQKDSAAAIQRAIDSGASTVFLPGSYDLRTTVTIRGQVRRVVGVGGTINYGRGLKPDFRLVDGDAPVVFFEHFAHSEGLLLPYTGWPAVRENTIEE